MSSEPLNGNINTDTISINNTEQEIDEEILGYEEKINADIGYYWWKKYISSAFWNNISTPMSLVITIITALTTGQSATKGLITDDMNFRLGITALMISTLNTFFRPAQQLMENMERMKMWAKLGTDFEKIYYDRVYTIDEKKVKLAEYQKLFNQVSEMKRDSTTNFFTDLIYLIARTCCLKNNTLWKTGALRCPR